MDFKYELVDFSGFLHIKIEPNDSIMGYVGNIDGWLSCDVQSCGNAYLPRIKEVLNSDNLEKEELFWGNAYKALVHKDFTTISYDFEDSWPEMVPCTLPTEMLCKILEIWIKACDEHIAKKEAKRAKKEENL